MLRSRLLGLGCDIICTILQCEAGLKLPSPQMYVGKGHVGRFYAYPDEVDDEGYVHELSDNDKANCEQWLHRSLTCMDKSLLSAFRYLPKPGPLHCEGHKDRGLLTIVLNPSGLEALVDGQWIPMDADELGRPLSSNCAVVFPGLTLEKATSGFFRATEHRVRNVGE